MDISLHGSSFGGSGGGYTKFILPRPTATVTVTPSEVTFKTLILFNGKGRLRELPISVGTNSGNFGLKLSFYLDGFNTIPIWSASAGTTQFLFKGGNGFTPTPWSATEYDDRYSLDLPFIQSFEVRVAMNTTGGSSNTVVNTTPLIEVLE